MLLLKGLTDDGQLVINFAKKSEGNGNSWTIPIHESVPFYHDGEGEDSSSDSSDDSDRRI